MSTICHISRFFIAATVAAFLSACLAIFFNFKQNQSACDENQLKYWPVVLERWNETDKLGTVKKVFESMGHRTVDGEKEDWDVLWAVDFPYEKFPEKIGTLKPHQLINHFPAITFLTNKMHLSISVQSKFIPVSFEFPRLKNEYLYYQQLNLEKKFVVKNYDRQGVRIVDFKDIDFFLREKGFFQEFIQNPLLIDGHAFELGVYALITSMDPLIIYKWNSDILLRFCPEPYQPFDRKNVNKYVVGDNHIPSWEMPSLMNATQGFNISVLDALNHHLTKEGQDTSKFWKQVEDAMISITFSKTSLITRFMNIFKEKNPGLSRGFFELLKFDFLIDDKLHIHLMEINMSPDLTPRFEKDKKLSSMYEQLVYNTMSTVGIVTRVEVKPKTEGESLMLSAPKDIAVNPEVCIGCIDSCSVESCELCLPCLSNETVSNFHQMYREQHRKGEFKRIFPAENYADEKFMKHYSVQEKLAVKWVKAKCENDENWCQ